MFDTAKLKAELIIPSYNRLATLRETLNQVATLYPDLGICLGLQGDEPTVDFLAEFKKRHLARIEYLPQPSTTRTLNHCITTSQADIVLILDDDAIPHFGWLETHLAAFARDPALVYTAGREVRSSKGRSSFSEWIRIIVEWFFGMFIGEEKKLHGRIVGWTTRLGFIFGNFDQPGICRINSPRGCNMAVRRVFFVEHGGFNENFRGNAWGFEAEFGLRLAQKDQYGQYRGDAIVIHDEISSGGSRTYSKSLWFADYIHNHKILMNILGKAGWIGSIPRLTKRVIWMFISQ